MAETTKVEIKPAKGRPMLTWVGKRPLRNVIAYPAQLVETFAPTNAPETNKDAWKDWPQDFAKGGLLFHGDNKDVLAHLLANGFRGKVKLIYIDPPFDSGADYVRKINLRGSLSTAQLLGETYTLGEQTQYSDIWANDNYLQFMYERLMLLKELLASDGSFYLHCDWHKSHHIRCLMDEVFGAEYIQNEIIWKRTSARSNSRTYNHIHDTILFYSKTADFVWNKLLEPHPDEYLERYYNYKDKDGRRFTALNLTAPGPRKGSSGLPWRGFDPNSQNSHWKYAIDKLDALDAQGKIYWPSKDGGWPRLKNYLDETEGRAIQSIWDDVFTVNSQAAERTEYPTQKSESLIERMISASSNPGDIVLDCFLGSGTTAAVAQQLGRRWIGADINKGAIQTTSKRLQGVIEEQLQTVQNKTKSLPGLEKDEGPAPAQASFGVYRVNDYDLQIQHNEALNLACEQLGVTRSKTDTFFDGTLGKKLVKIVPFNHPVTPLDLEEIKRELGNRPEEERDVVMISYGAELAVQTWLEKWNRHRKRTGLPNQIEVKDLRVDAKSGGFFIHKPAEVEINFQRDGEQVSIEIENFISPTIIERLKSQSGLLTPQIDDWRAMVDSVMIDAAYNGEVFNVTLADVPEKKNDLVQGKYLVQALSGAKIAVKVTDMLGEEVLVVKAD